MHRKLPNVISNFSYLKKKIWHSAFDKSLDKFFLYNHGIHMFYIPWVLWNPNLPLKIQIWSLKCFLSQEMYWTFCFSVSKKSQWAINKRKRLKNIYNYLWQFSVQPISILFDYKRSKCNILHICEENQGVICGKNQGVIWENRATLMYSSASSFSSSIRFTIMDSTLSALNILS